MTSQHWPLFPWCCHLYSHHQYIGDSQVYIPSRDLALEFQAHIQLRRLLSRCMSNRIFRCYMCKNQLLTPWFLSFPHLRKWKPHSFSDGQVCSGRTCTHRSLKAGPPLRNSRCDTTGSTQHHLWGKGSPESGRAPWVMLPNAPCHRWLLGRWATKQVCRQCKMHWISRLSALERM